MAQVWNNPNVAAQPPAPAAPVAPIAPARIVRGRRISRTMIAATPLLQILPSVVQMSRATIGVVELVKPSGKVGINVSFGISEGASTASGPGGDFNGDGLTDLVGIYSYPGINPAFKMWLFAGRRDAATPGTMAQGPTSVPWQTDGSWDSAKARFVTGDFNGDSLSDVVGVYEYPGYNPSIKMHLFAGRRDAVSPSTPVQGPASVPWTSILPSVEPSRMPTPLRTAAHSRNTAVSMLSWAAPSPCG